LKNNRYKSIGKISVRQGHTITNRNNNNNNNINDVDENDDNNNDNNNNIIPFLFFI